MPNLKPLHRFILLFCHLQICYDREGSILINGSSREKLEKYIQVIQKDSLIETYSYIDWCGHFLPSHLLGSTVKMAFSRKFRTYI